MHRSVTLCGTVLLALALVSCRQSAPAEEAREEGGSDDHSKQEESQDTVPLVTRAEDAERDAGEKPQQVMDELGIESGSKVADVIAGGGYYTYLLSERVGPEGMVYATGARGLDRRLKEGDLAGRQNITIIDSLGQVPPGTLDAVLINRAYHLLNNPEQSFFPQLRAALKPGGVVAVIEVRLDKPTGHDMKTHRMGEDTVRQELERGGFMYAGASDLLANPDDPRTDFMEGKRHLADRMFLIFEKPEETASSEES